ncbi:SUMF1/EgtB/PvdO family nonheme iron enzyme [Chrysosporum bergii ANA360D]|uniref:SUMF1/EgtB/PvdO family nonheme iron enzyme n=1 Tax=Chrysosporum bergii ANA360D TaxID=617107 RepID=A0AA43GNJ3_9CYAN|nr:SUMF1/EgtB/PvdO family nonheme iron enzyme [Chrysosporum bergii]MDH6059011.1 SUMF1/EgtB/PvdO family nonheme iron enzyme [Chrysosporum bergii ANA360D]
MTRVALLIGISEYEPGLTPLPKAVDDVEAMREVLVNPEMGGFAEEDVTVLKNPQRQEMENAIYHLYANRQKDDLVLLYFSGHGVTDESGDFYFSTRQTKKNQNKLIPTTAVAATNVHLWMNKSKSKRLIVILDCCFSGAFAKGLTAKDTGNIDLRQQLGGEGRAILTASTSTQYAFESDGLNLSIYTHYLVEGIKSGAADEDGDGLISIDELHQYAKSKVQEASPAMTPEFYPHKEGFRIFIAKSSKDDPGVKYRREVEHRLNRGKFTIPARRLLNSLRVQLQLDSHVADAIEFEVQQPYREYQRKLKEYEETLRETVAVEGNLTESTLQDLRDYQQHLGLRDEDVAPIRTMIMSPEKPSASAEHIIEASTVDDQDTSVESSPEIAKFFTEDLGNNVLLDMVAIPGGTFLMGSPEDEPERDDSEGPQHSVTIQPFFMGKFPVTQAQWATVAAFDKVNIDLDPYPSEFQGAKRPVECISWDEAVEFCRRLSRKTGKIYRLPSEAEWEYACRGGTTTPFYFGDTISPDWANYDVNLICTFRPNGEYPQETTNVGEFPANPFGLFDICGDVWEWCQDVWHENYHDAPTDGSPWLADKYQFRCLRGGSWYDTGYICCRSAYRGYASPQESYINLGLRVVCVPGIKF